MKQKITQFFPWRNTFRTSETDAGALRRMLTALHPLNTTTNLIRVGPSGDGGYLIPDDLDGLVACFSPGVSDISGFEVQCAERGMEVFMADASVAGPAEQHPRFHFVRKFLAAVADEQCLTLDDWVSTSLPENSADLLLQMDIEGFEYEVLLAASDQLMQRFRILVVEFHTLDQLWNRPWFDFASSVLRKILRTHICVHAHPNNFYPVQKRRGLEIPPLLELTFYRKDRAKVTDFATQFPHPLDGDNTGRPHMPLPACLFSPGRWPRCTNR